MPEPAGSTEPTMPRLDGCLDDVCASTGQCLDPGDCYVEDAMPPHTAPNSDQDPGSWRRPDPTATIRVLLHDLAAVMEGRTMRVTDTTGKEYDLRLFGADEFMYEQHAAVDKARPGNGSAKITLERARDLTRPMWEITDVT